MKKVFYRLRDRGLLQRVEGREAATRPGTGVKVRLGVSEVFRLYGEAQGYRVGLVACPMERHGGTLKVVVGALNVAELEPVAAVIDVPDAVADADRIGNAVLRAFQVAERHSR
ncbi:hypothetical protein ACIQW5_29110 [Methylorubrum thiocyanatum]|uniref:hypothetical protein n=1 Tax=Methylorubrum thiocyanatum TaxID=47958 RepID=UPI00383A3FC4